MSSFGQAGRTGNAEGKCDLAGMLPIAYDRALAESAELAFAAVAADAANAANAARLAKSFLWVTCIDKRSADKANSY
jgi:hypothetical protein